MLATVNLAQIYSISLQVYDATSLNTWGVGDSLRASAVFECAALEYYVQQHVTQIICARVMR